MDSENYFQVYTSRRPQYKSRVERQIGDLLAERQIPFIYEKPTAVMDNGKLKIWYPDFSLQCGPLVEYFGITGDRDYIQRTRHKLRVYHANQLDTIPVYPSDIIPNWQEQLMARIGTVLENRLRVLRQPCWRMTS